MSTFILLTRLNPDSIAGPTTIEQTAHRVMERVRSECHGVKWHQSYATLGPYDYVDVFEAPDIETATKVSLIVRLLGDAHTEVWPATPWRVFKDIVHEIPRPGEAAHRA